MMLFFVDLCEFLRVSALIVVFEADLTVHYPEKSTVPNCTGRRTRQLIMRMTILAQRYHDNNVDSNGWGLRYYYVGGQRQGGSNLRDSTSDCRDGATMVRIASQFFDYEVAFFELGIRMNQVKLCYDTRSDRGNGALTRHCWFELGLAVDSIQVVMNARHLSKRFAHILAEALRYINAMYGNISDGDWGIDLDESTKSLRRLAEHCSQPLGKQSERAMDFLDLGMELANGRQSFKRSPPTGVQRVAQSRSVWNWKSRRRLNSLLRKLELDRNTVFPRVNARQMSELYTSNSFNGWSRAEAGIKQLRQRTKHQAKLRQVTKPGEADSEWFHSPTEPIPDDYKFGPLDGNQKNLAKAIRPASPDSRALRQIASSGAIWVLKVSVQQYQVYFRNEQAFSRAEQQLERIRESQKTAKTN
jgi:hypothetical protein